jgi:uncharacterized membrane protein
VEITVYHSFRIYTWDLGIFNQALWNTLHGRLLYYTAEPLYTKTGCFLGAHFSPIVLFALPFYAVYPTGDTLLVLSTLLVAVGALPAYEIAKLLLKNEKAAVILGIFYLLYPSLQGVTLSGFSPESFMGTIFLFIAYYLLKADYKKLALALSLGLITHESAVPVIAFIAIYGMLYYRSFKTKGFKVSLIILAICIPYFFFAQYMRTYFGWTGQPSLWREWSLMGATGTPDLPFKIIMNPMGAWRSLTFDGAQKVLYALILFLPALFLPLLGWQGLIPAVPYLLISFFSSYSIYYSVEGHYGAFVAPFVFMGLIHGIIWLQKNRRLNISELKLVKLALLTCIILLSILLPLSYSQYEIFAIHKEHNNIVYNFIASIPQNASVLTQSNIFPHLANRPDAYTIPSPMWGDRYKKIGKEILQNLSKVEVKYVLLDFNSESYYASAAELIESDFIAPSGNRYRLIDAKDGVVLFCLKI